MGICIYIYIYIIYIIYIIYGNPYDKYRYKCMRNVLNFVNTYLQVCWLTTTSTLITRIGFKLREQEKGLK